MENNECNIEIFRCKGDKVFFFVYGPDSDDGLPNVCCFKSYSALMSFLNEVDSRCFSQFKIYEGIALLVAER